MLCAQGEMVDQVSRGEHPQKWGHRIGGASARTPNLLTPRLSTEEPTMKTFKPPHSGLIIIEDGLPHLGLSVTEAANQIGVSSGAPSRAINGRGASGHGEASRAVARRKR
jgi:hypothetical protein